MNLDINEFGRFPINIKNVVSQELIHGELVPKLELTQPILNAIEEIQRTLDVYYIGKMKKEQDADIDIIDLKKSLAGKISNNTLTILLELVLKSKKIVDTI